MAQAAKSETGKTEKLKRFLGEIAAYEREFKKWEVQVEKILKRYRDDDRKQNDRGEGEVKFNILWSNVQTLVPATFSRIPKADVSRRYNDNDPVGRVASLILERALEYEIEHYPDFRETTRADVLDRFLGGRGTAWARYEPHIRAKKEGTPTDGVQVTEDVDLPQEELDYECAPVDYVHWKDFGHSVARKWEELSCVWRRVYMQMDAKVERFGEKKAKSIPKDAMPKDGRYQNQSTNTNPEGLQDEGSWVYELWDKSRKEVSWFHKSMRDVLETIPDPLGLEEFFPCPKPLYATLTNDSLKPVPDFVLYQDQARSLDTIADRVYGLVNMLQVKGVYDGSADKAIGRLFTEGGNGNLLPIKNWSAFAEKNGLKGAIDIVDLDPIARALKEAYQAFDYQVQSIYQITGIADIVRGVSDPNETLGAQEIKQNFVGLRLGDMKMTVAQFVTELLQLKAQIICTKFSPETIVKIAAVDQLTEVDKQYIPQAMALLIGPERLQDPDAESPNPMRGFRIQVNANTLVQIDEQQEKQSRMELLTAFGGALEKSAQVVMAAPQALPLIIEVLKYGVTAFPVGKSIEGQFDALLDQMRQQPPQPKPDPEMAKVQAQKEADQASLQADLQKQQAEHQLDREKAQQDMALEREKHTQQMQFDREKFGQEMQMRQQEHQANIALKTHEAEQNHALASQKQSHEMQMQEKDHAIKRGDQLMKAKEAGVDKEVMDLHPDVRPQVDERHQMEIDALQKLMQSQEQLMHAIQVLGAQMQAIAQGVTADKEIVRGPDGRVAGVRAMMARQ